MRLDIFLSSLGIIKRRTEAKRIADTGLIMMNERVAKPGANVSVGCVIQIGGSRPQKITVLELPQGSVPKEKRDQYFKTS